MTFNIFFNIEIALFILEKDEIQDYITSLNICNIQILRYLKLIIALNIDLSKLVILYSKNVTLQVKNVTSFTYI